MPVPLSQKSFLDVCGLLFCLLCFYLCSMSLAILPYVLATWLKASPPLIQASPLSIPLTIPTSRTSPGLLAQPGLPTQVNVSSEARQPGPRSILKHPCYLHDSFLPVNSSDPTDAITTPRVWKDTRSQITCLISQITK